MRNWDTHKAKRNRFEHKKHNIQIVIQKGNHKATLQVIGDGWSHEVNDMNSDLIDEDNILKNIDKVVEGNEKDKKRVLDYLLSLEKKH